MNAYLYPVARVNGGNHQDIGTEGAIPVLMNVAYYLEFLNIKLATKADSILEQHLATLLGSMEVITMLLKCFGICPCGRDRANTVAC